MFLVTFSGTLLHALWETTKDVDSVFCVSLQEQSSPTGKDEEYTIDTLPRRERNKLTRT